MSTPHPNSDPCCSIPPVQVDYTTRGTYGPYGSFNRVYITGESTKTALIVVYDIFGYFSQTLQGADILAEAIGAKVFILDFFGEGNAYNIERFPPGNEEDKKYLSVFIDGVANPIAATAKLVAFSNVLKAEGFTKVGALGYCWGGKVVFMGALSEGCSLDAISAVHPRISAQDAEGLNIPLGFYASGDESREEFDKILDVVSKKPFAAKVDTKYYSNMFHGWAAARGNLSDPENKREYEDVYSRAAAFFKRAFA